MGYWVSNMFGIRVGGVFHNINNEKSIDDQVREDIRVRISKIILSMRGSDHEPSIGQNKEGDPIGCLSQVLHGNKGSYITLAGIFNYWTYSVASEFAKRLSEEFKTHVMHMCWDEEIDATNCQVWNDGEPIKEKDY